MAVNSKKIVRIGSGAGYSGDRIEPAVELAKKGKLDYLVFECLAERTIALAQLRKLNDPSKGYDPLLEERMLACLSICTKNNVKIITNMGAANPEAAMLKVVEIAKSLQLPHLKIAAILGDELTEKIRDDEYSLLETGKPLSSIKKRMVSANAYLGAEPIVEALVNGADVVITGRVADPSMFLAPLIKEFNWSLQDYNLLGKGTALGHLMECAGHVTGGYFADPGYKDVPNLEDLGFPIVEANTEGGFFITKLNDSGGMVTMATCKEQLLYEIHDPVKYLTPDVIADFSKVKITEIEKDKILIEGATGQKKTGKLKVSIGYRDGFIGEGQLSYGGPGAMDRARLGLEIVRKRLEKYQPEIEDVRYDIVGFNSLYGNQISNGKPYEVRMRVAARTSTKAAAVKIGNEVEALYTNGPAGGGGAKKSVQEVIAVQSILIDEEKVVPSIKYKII